MTTTMTTLQNHPPPRPAHSNGLVSRIKTTLKTDGPASDANSSNQVAHTLTACTRCRQRKTRCDPQLPRCGPCERTNSQCEYYDSNKGHVVSRGYVVFLQHKVKELEEELERVENEDSADDPEALMRAASVRVHDAVDSKYLGPSSGIAISRLVLQLAKQFTDAKSIKDIVPEQRAQQGRELYHQEQAKPTSKVYPLISDVAAVDLPNRPLTDLLVALYKLKVQPMYPALHEPTLDKDIDAVYVHGENASPFQNFICRMVIAISLQKMDSQYAGLADSYYLAALKYFESVVRPMDLKTLQCFALMAEYSLLTPTRTAIYYIVGMAVRLMQALGYAEERTITRGVGDAKADCLEIDMRRRMFWCTIVMDYGLAHSLGRPGMLAMRQEHIDVNWFETCDDKYITPDGIDPVAPRPTLKKWVAIHFFKMRLLQLEIRRALYQKKQPEPKDESHEWFIQMEAKLMAWRDASPSADEGHGLDQVWFIGRYNTMVVFMYRPSPQVPRPSTQAALKCFEACKYNIHMHREQIAKKNVDLTWIFTQAIFMAINTILWSLSYEEVRRKHCKVDVENILELAMDSIQLASERWPGVATAVQLYSKLISAVLQIYEKDGDIPISASTPSDVPSPAGTYLDGYNGQSRTTSPATVSTASVATPPERAPAPFGYLPQGGRRSVEQPPPVPYQSSMSTVPQRPTPPRASPSLVQATMQDQSMDYLSAQGTTDPYAAFDPTVATNPLPAWGQHPAIASWQAQTVQYPHPSTMPTQSQFDAFSHPVFDPNNAAYPFPGVIDQDVSDQYATQQYWDVDMGSYGTGLNEAQQQELMHSLETDGMEDIQSMISSTLASITPKTPSQPSF